jgi:hypothetical protein
MTSYVFYLDPPLSEVSPDGSAVRLDRRQAAPLIEASGSYTSGRASTPTGSVFVFFERSFYASTFRDLRRFDVCRWLIVVGCGFGLVARLSCRVSPRWAPFSRRGGFLLGSTTVRGSGRGG